MAHLLAGGELPAKQRPSERGGHHLGARPRPPMHRPSLSISARGGGSDEGGDKPSVLLKKREIIELKAVFDHPTKWDRLGSARTHCQL